MEFSNIIRLLSPKLFGSLLRTYFICWSTFYYLPVGSNNITSFPQAPKIITLPISYSLPNEKDVNAMENVKPTQQLLLNEYNTDETFKSNETTANTVVAISELDIRNDSINFTGNQTDNITSVFSATRLLDKLLQSYDNRLRPGFGGPPTKVDVNLNIRSMGPISEKDMSYQMDCYFRQNWVDKRLKFDGPIKIMPVSINILQKIWKPDTHFLNGKRSLLHTVTSPNKLLRISRDGTILYSMRLTIKASCPMYLENFPMDTQTCPLKFGSHGYNTDDVVYHWTHGAGHSIKMADDMTLSQFDLIGFPHINENVTQNHNNFGEFSVLSVRFALQRHMGYFLINVYVPCSLLVICSWVGFWINREATSDRIALGVTTVLTMAFLKIDNSRDSPEVSYSTALDYFMGTCFALVLATIIEFAGVHYFTKHGSGEIEFDSDDEDAFLDYPQDHPEIVRRYSLHNSVRSKRRQNGDNNGTYIPADTQQPIMPRDSCCFKFWNCVKGSSKYRNQQMRRPSTNTSGAINSVSKIDIAARILFPLVFASFNIFYWWLYIVYGDNEVIM